MAYTTINKSTANFNTKLYTGNAGTNAQTGVGFKPDWVWLKQRSGSAASHKLYDSVRGTTKYIASNNTGAEATDSNGLTAFGTDGFTVGSSAGTNANNQTYVAWNWLGANGTASNTTGSINSTVSVNTTSGFSIVKYTATGSNATVGHGLSSVPKMIIIKDLEDSGGSNWGVYHNSIGNTDFLELNSTAAKDTSSGLWNNTTPTSSVFSIGTNSRVNNSGNDFIAYCFAEKQGYSKFGSYIGNGNNGNGTFVYTGFKPAFVMVKKSSATNNWVMTDNKRDSFNDSATNYLLANDNSAEGTGLNFDLLSNGFKLKSNSGGTNTSGATYIYMAFGQSIVGTNNVPATAK